MIGGRTRRMRFSILIPTYNRAPIIADAIRSVHAQAEAAAGRVEIVIVDDSTDDTIDVARRAAAELPCCPMIVDKPSRRLGVTGARNRGIELSTGDFIVVLDSDDQLTPDALSSVVRLLSEHPDVDLLFGRIRNKSGRPARCRADFLNRLVKYDELIQTDAIGEFLPVVRRSALMESGLRFAEEAEGSEGILWRRLARAGYRVWYTSTVLRLYDDVGADRNSSLTLRLKRAGVFARGHTLEVREFGPDLRRLNHQQYVKKVLKAMVYCRLAGSRDLAGDAFLRSLHPALHSLVSLIPVAALRTALGMSVRAHRAGLFY